MIFSQQVKTTRRLLGTQVDAIAITITILINLTYGDTNNKQFLCGFSDFLPALMHHLSTMDEQILSKGSQVLRNLSCKATQEIKDGLLKCNAAGVLMEAVEYANGETTTQHITGALWNISAHSNEVRHRLCTIGNGIETLVGLLSYNSPSGATVVIENVGGVLKNLSSVISQEEEYRRRFREAGGLAKLVQHLKSKNRTVLANATGIYGICQLGVPKTRSCFGILDQYHSLMYCNPARKGILQRMLGVHCAICWRLVTAMVGQV